MVVKVEASEERVHLIGLVNLSTEMDILPATALPNMFSRDSFLRSERVDQYLAFYHLAPRTLPPARLTTLQTRRVRGDMIQAYKIMTGKEKIDREQFFQLADSNYGLRTDRPNLDIRRRRRRSLFASGNISLANEWSTHGINSLNTSWTHRPSTLSRTG